MLIQAFLTGSLFGLLTITAMAQLNWRVQVRGRTLDAKTGKPVYCTVELYNAQGRCLLLQKRMAMVTMPYWFLLKKRWR